jgi:hypothetical protein
VFVYNVIHAIGHLTFVIRTIPIPTLTYAF